MREVWTRLTVIRQVTVQLVDKLPISTPRVSGWRRTIQA